ncbi:MAG TPA: NADH-quinone oxidoreductase subunit NuoE [Mycobacteriales bacterium]|nr:NADH-quinone oxidoreductase subunit NuoE [Mycobacteriales bacterium]
MPFTDETRSRARQIIARYPRPRSALLPMLHLVQSEEGYVSPDGVAFCAQELGLTKAEVGAVATFYTMYKRGPTGEWLVSVCTNLACQILGGEEIYACLSRHLEVGYDETTPDGRITFEHAECLAACDYAPVFTVNYEFFDNATPESALGVVQALQRGERPHPTRGEPLVTFREIEAQLAGFLSAASISAATDTGEPAHPDPPTPVDSRSGAGLEGTDLAPPPGSDRYGVPDGITEERVSAAEAASTYGAGGAADAAPGGAAQAPEGGA